jgi:hypothetical protein
MTTTTLTYTYNRDDIQRVYASFAADYRMVAEWTALRSDAEINRNIAAVQAVAEAQYLREVHLQLKTQAGRIREAAVYRVSTSASGWSADRPGSLYWDSDRTDDLELIVFYNSKWTTLAAAERDAFRARYLPGWGPSDFNGHYGPMASSVDRRYASRAYGIERIRYSS